MMVIMDGFVGDENTYFDVIEKPHPSELRNTVEPSSVAVAAGALALQTERLGPLRQM